MNEETPETSEGRAPALSPIAPLQGTTPYEVRRPGAPCDLHLDGNEGVGTPPALIERLRQLGEPEIRSYPGAPAQALRARLAARYALPVGRVLVTAGADDALYRACAAMLDQTRALVVATPTFEMIPRYAELTGAHIARVPWPDAQPYPLQSVLSTIEELGERVGMVALVSPNNPTGQILGRDVLEHIAAAAPGALIVLDHAYVEFAGRDHDLTGAALELPNALVVRTLSKAWGLAGLRTGYAMGSPEVIAWLSAAGNPYAVAGPSAALAWHRLGMAQDDVAAFAARARTERALLAEALSAHGATPTPSQANFAFARHPDPVWVRDVMAGQGVAIRAWPGDAERADALRISCPGDPGALERAVGALELLAPEAVLFDMDGVLVDVSRSYRAAILATAAHFGVEITRDQISTSKREGHANNDWSLTRQLIRDHGASPCPTLEAVTEVFEGLYQGDAQTPGLREREALTVDRGWLERLAAKTRLGIVTGRPRADADFALERHDLADLFEVVVCMEDTEQPKPDPAPVLSACEAMGIERAWFIGDTPDDMAAARAATLGEGPCRVLGLGILAPDEPAPTSTTRALLEAGAGRVLGALDEFIERLP